MIPCLVNIGRCAYGCVWHLLVVIAGLQKAIVHLTVMYYTLLLERICGQY